MTKNVSTEATSDFFFNRLTSWIRSNTVEFYILMTLLPAFIMGFSMGVSDASFSELFSSVHTMHTTHTNISIGYFGFGTAMFNASGTALFYYIYGKLTKVEWTASPFMSVMVIFAFSFHMINFYGILFLLVGILITSTIFKTSLDKSFGAASLSAGLTPIFSFLAFGENSLVPQAGGILLGGLIMMLITIMAQQIGALVAKVNDGLTLANTGVSNGFLAVFFYTLIIISGSAVTSTAPDILYDRLLPGYTEGSITDFLPYATDQWYMMAYMGTITTVNLIIFWFIFPKQNGLMDVLKKDGKAPTDWFVVSGKREAAFNIWSFMMLSIVLTGIWTGVSGTSFGMNTTTTVAFLQVFAFSAFGENLVGAIIMTLGSYVAWYFTLAAGPNSGGFFEEGSKWAVAWDKEHFMALVMGGWLLTPLVGVNFVAPFIAAIFHAAWHRMFGGLTGGFTYMVHGFATFMAVVFLVPFFQSFNLIRKPKGTLQNDASVAESNWKLERSKVVAMSTELLYYLSDEGAEDLAAKFKFTVSASILTLTMKNGKEKLLNNLVDELNEFKRDAIMEYNMWSSLGASAATRNLALLAQMTNSAEYTKKGNVHTLTLTRKRSRKSIENAKK